MERELIIRCFETSGVECKVNFKFFKDLAGAWETDIIEYDQVQLPVKGNTLSTKVEPYKIKTCRVNIKGSDDNPV